ncbi:MAG: hypothetical protein ABGW84_12765 [Sphingomonadaceae bacterium]
MRIRFEGSRCGYVCCVGQAEYRKVARKCRLRQIAIGFQQGIGITIAERGIEPVATGDPRQCDLAAPLCPSPFGREPCTGGDDGASQLFLEDDIVDAPIGNAARHLAGSARKHFERIDRFGRQVLDILDPCDALAIDEEDRVFIAVLRLDLVEEFADGGRTVGFNIAFIEAALRLDPAQSRHDEAVGSDDDAVFLARLLGRRFLCSKLERKSRQGKDSDRGEAGLHRPFRTKEGGGPRSPAPLEGFQIGESLRNVRAAPTCR